MNKEEEYLTILMEECAEVSQIICKILRFGKYSKNPLLEHGETNIELLQNEIGDLLAIIELLNTEHSYLNQEKIKIAIAKKKNKVKNWMTNGEGWKHAKDIHNNGELNDNKN